MDFSNFNGVAHGLWKGWYENGSINYIYNLMYGSNHGGIIRFEYRVLNEEKNQKRRMVA